MFRRRAGRERTPEVGSRRSICPALPVLPQLALGYLARLRIFLRHPFAHVAPGFACASAALIRGGSAGGVARQEEIKNIAESLRASLSAEQEERRASERRTSRSQRRERPPMRLLGVVVVARDPQSPRQRRAMDPPLTFLDSACVTTAPVVSSPRRHVLRPWAGPRPGPESELAVTRGESRSTVRIRAQEGQFRASSRMSESWSSGFNLGR